MNEIKNFNELNIDELENINGGIGVVAGALIAGGVIFGAGVITGICESLTD